MTGFHAMWSAAAVVGAGYASLTIALDWSLPRARWSLVGRRGGSASTHGPERGCLHWPTHLDPFDGRLKGPCRTYPGGPILLLGLPTFAMWLTDSATSVWSGIYLEDGLDVPPSVAPIAFGATRQCCSLVRLVG